MNAVASVLGAVAAAGVAYQLLSAMLAGGRRSSAAPSLSQAPAVTILKPLHGAEPRLAANLATFLAQDYAGAVQMVCGVADPDDAAVAAVTALRRDYPQHEIALVADATRHGRNAKVSNLINMMAAARHDVVLLSDSDIAVVPDYLARIVAQLGKPGVGAVSCLYHGRGDAGPWSRLAAMAIDYGFLPSVLVGMRFGLADPCMGSTIAVTRATLDRIGGFAAFADALADDYALGAAVRRLGLAVAVPRFTVAHACVDDSLAALAAHELRWSATIGRLSPLGFAIGGWLNPVPVALLAGLASGFAPASLAVLAAALAARVAVALRIDRFTGVSPAPIWLLPLRDCLTFGLFLGSFLVQSVEWRGSRLRVSRAGQITGE